MNNKKLDGRLENAVGGKFVTPVERRIEKTYLDVLNGYNLAKAESALNSLFNADDHIGKLRPAAIPNTEGINRTVPMNRIKEIKIAINAAAKLIKGLETDLRDAASIPANPLKKG